jgi:hypothetical protein
MEIKMTKAEFVKLVQAYSLLNKQELEDLYELRYLLDAEQVRAIVFVRTRS